MLISIIFLSIVIIGSIAFNVMLFRRFCSLKKDVEQLEERLFNNTNDLSELNDDIQCVNDNIKIINDSLGLHIAVDHHIKKLHDYGTQSTAMNTQSWAVVCTKDKNNKQTCNFYQLPDEYTYIKQLMNFLKNMRFKIIDTHPQFEQYIY